MGRTFTVEIEGDPEALFEKGRAIAQANGVSFSGDSTAGTFSGMGAAGSYGREGQTLSITVDKKPAFVPWSMLASQLDKFFR